MSYPVSIKQWEPQIGAVSLIKVGGNMVEVVLERDCDNIPTRWKSKLKDDQFFSCEDYRYWAPKHPSRI